LKNEIPVLRLRYFAIKKTAFSREPVEISSLRKSLKLSVLMNNIYKQYYLYFLPS